MLTAILKNHMMLIRVAADKFSCEVSAGKGGDKAVPFEIPTNCCDI